MTAILIWLLGPLVVGLLVGLIAGLMHAER